MSKSYCPVCGVRRVESKHHIKPRAEGGDDSKRNKVPLCRICHDIVEEIYDTTGMAYNQALTELIRTEYLFTVSMPPINHTEYPLQTCAVRHIVHSMGWSNKEFVNAYMNEYRSELRRISNLYYNQHVPEFKEGYMKDHMKEWRKRWHEHAGQFGALRAKLRMNRGILEGACVT